MPGLLKDASRTGEIITVWCSGGTPRWRNNSTADSEIWPPDESPHCGDVVGAVSVDECGKQVSDGGYDGSGGAQGRQRVDRHGDARATAHRDLGDEAPVRGLDLVDPASSV